MKSRVLAILLVVALLVTVAVFGVQAEEPLSAEVGNAVSTAAAELDFSGEVTTCPVCGDGVTWVGIGNSESTYKLTDASYNGATHFYLTEDLDLASKQLQIHSGTVCLHLNNHNVTQSGSNLSAIQARYTGTTLNIMGSGIVTGRGSGVTSDGINWKAGGAVQSWGTTVNLFGGTYKCTDTRMMPVISTFVAANSSINMYDGVTIDGSNNTAETECTSCVYILGATHTFNMFGGTISGGQATDGGENIKALDGTVNLAGGEVDGGVYIGEDASITVSGDAQVASTNGGIDLTGGALLNLGELTTGAEVYVTANESEAFTVANDNAQTLFNAGYIKDTKTEKAIYVNTDNQLVLGTVKAAADAMTFSGSTTAVCPYCGTVETWSALTAITANGTLASGHYYLDANTDYGAVYRYYVVDKVCINLNGQDMESTAGQVFWVSKASGTGTVTGELTIMGTGSVTGKSTVNSTAADQRGGVFNVNHADSSNRDPDVVLNLFGGTYASNNNGTVFTGRSSANNMQVIFNMYDGQIIGTENQTNPCVAMLHAANTFNMYGGSITGAKKAANGGSVYVMGEFNMYDGTITGGNAATGGNLNIQAGSTFKMSGGLLTLGVATGNGGNIYATGADGKRTTIEISGTAQITDGQAAGNGSGGVYLGSYVDATMTGGTVSGNKNTNEGATYGGGNFTVSANSTLTVSGTAQIKNGESATYGGNISARAAGAEVTIDGGNISGGTASGNGGSIYVTGGTIDITGGKIGVDKDGNAAGGTTEANGGNLYLAGAAVATISSDAEIANGSANRGGNIGFGNSAQLTVNADAQDETKVPTISGGTATEYGGNIFATGAFTMNAGNVKGGYAAEEGGSMYFMNWDNTADVKIAINGGVINGKPYEDAGVNNGGHGGLIYAYTNPDHASGKGLTLTLKDVTLTNGKIDTTYNGSAVYMSGSTLILDGDTQIDDSNNDSPVYITGTSTMTVNADFTGEVRVYASLADGTTYGNQMLSSGSGAYTCTGAYTGTVRLLNITGACAVGQYETSTRTGTLWVAGVVLCKDDTIVDGTLTTADAVAKFASGDYDYIRSYMDETTFVLTDEAVTYVIDLDGRDITVNAAEGVTGVVFAGLDTNATTSAASGAVATLGEGVINGVQYNNNGTIYIGLESEGTVAYHALKMDITGVSLRTTTGGIYYWASVKCDDTLAAELDSFGIIFGINEAAPAGIGEDLTMFSEITTGILTDGTEMTGAIMNNVLEAGRTDPTNDAAGAMKIWGVPYVTITYTDADGYEQTAEILAGEAQSAHMSIYDVVSKLDAYIGTLEDTDANKEKYLKMLTENFKWDDYDFTSKFDDWAGIKASLDAKKAALNTETAE